MTRVGGRLTEQCMHGNYTVVWVTADRVHNTQVCNSISDAFVLSCGTHV